MPEMPFYREGVFPPPVGTGHTFANLRAGINSPTFDLAAQQYIVTFQPVDMNNPGVLTLYNSAGTALVTLRAGGYGDFNTQAITGAYFTATLGAKIASVMRPYTGGRQ